MWPFNRKKAEKAAELVAAEASTIAMERSAKASQLRLARKMNQILKKLQEAQIDVGLKSIGDALAGNREER